MISIKSLFKSSIIYGLGSALVRIMTFALVPLYTNDGGWYGHYVMIFPIIGILRACYSHGSGDSFLKLYSQSKNKKELISTYIIHTIIVTIGISIILMIIHYFVPLQNAQSLIGLLQIYFYYILIIVGLDTLNYRIMDILRIKNYPLYYMIVHFFGQLITILLAIYYVTNQDLGLKGALLALVYGGLMTFIMFVPILFKYIDIKKYSPHYVKQIFALGVRFFPATIFFLLMTQIDKFLIYFFLPNAEPIVGAYGAAVKLASIPMLFIGAFNLGWQPFYLSNGNDSKAIEKYEKIGTAFAILTLSLAWFVAIIMPLIANMNIPYIGKVVNMENYPMSSSIIPIIVIAHFFYALYIINMPSIYVCNKQNWSPIFRMFGAIVNLILNIILIPKYEMLGAALATSISYALMFSWLFYKNKKWMPINLAWYDIIFLGLISIVSVWNFMIVSPWQYYSMVITILYIGFLLYKHGLKQLILLFNN